MFLRKFYDKGGNSHIPDILPVPAKNDKPRCLLYIFKKKTLRFRIGYYHIFNMLLKLID